MTLESDFTRDDFLFDNGIPARGQFLPNINGDFPDLRWIGEPDLEDDIIEASTLGYRLEHRFTDWTVLRKPSTSSASTARKRPSLRWVLNPTSGR